MNSFIDELVQGWPDAEHEIKGLTYRGRYLDDGGRRGRSGTGP